MITLGAPFEILHGASLRGVIMSIPAQAIDGPLNRQAPLATGLDLAKGWAAWCTPWCAA